MKINYLDTDNVQGKDFVIHRKKGLDSYLFVLFKSPVTLWSDGKYTDVDSGNCILFDKHAFQHYYPRENTELLHDFIDFDTENEYEDMLLAAIPKGVPIGLALPKIITEVLTLIKGERYGGSSSFCREILTNLGEIFLYRLRDELDNKTSDGKTRPHFDDFYSIRSEIYASPQLPWSIDGISKRLCMSRSYFQHLYKEFFSVSCTEDIISARLSYARLLLFSTSLPVAEIAERCGYASTEHFIKQFRARTGKTPGRFRAEM